ncbi:tyrosine-type recombinase/integrase [Paraburkholderia youngii]|uniref:tyrosine-type recombinase/integrase n=1 Tax=Paraburkholderia TaxID=1822464 RepID=UPI003D255E5E
MIRPFAKYLKQFSPEAIVPRRDLCGQAHRRLAPHIYTERELNELVAASAALLPAGSIRPLTYEALFGLIAATGLRISEAINLSRSDVNLDDGTLIVRETKFHKSRLIPLHPTVTRVLERYADRRLRVIAAVPCNSFFVGTSGKKLPIRTVEGTFDRIRRQLATLCPFSAVCGHCRSLVPVAANIVSSTRNVATVQIERLLSRSRDSGSTSTGPWTKRETRSISCCAPTVTRLPRSAT